MTNMWVLHVTTVTVRRHVYDRQDEYRAWVKNVAPMENVMRESQQVTVLYNKHDAHF